MNFSLLGAGMSSARVDYIAPWWTYWLHSFPHINLRFQPIENSFQPEEENYQQVRMWDGAQGQVALKQEHTLTGAQSLLLFDIIPLFSLWFMKSYSGQVRLVIIIGPCRSLHSKYWDSARSARAKSSNYSS